MWKSFFPEDLNYFFYYMEWDFSIPFNLWTWKQNKKPLAMGTLRRDSIFMHNSKENSMCQNCYFFNLKCRMEIHKLEPSTANQHFTDFLPKPSRTQQLLACNGCMSDCLWFSHRDGIVFWEVLLEIQLGRERVPEKSLE